jgi:hypothetical protein
MVPWFVRYNMFWQRAHYFVSRITPGRDEMGLVIEPSARPDSFDAFGAAQSTHTPSRSAAGLIATCEEAECCLSFAAGSRISEVAPTST